MSQALVFTPKELRHLAQGCERSELPWGSMSERLVPRRGSVTAVFQLTQPFQGRPGTLA